MGTSLDQVERIQFVPVGFEELIFRNFVNALKNNFSFGQYLAFIEICIVFQVLIKCLGSKENSKKFFKASYMIHAVSRASVYVNKCLSKNPFECDTERLRPGFPVELIV